jgi:hypothetical protein
MSFFKENKGQSQEGKINDYATPKSAWNSIIDYLPKNKICYEPFYLDGGSGKILKDLGINVIHKPIDFYENGEKFDYILTNPPFQNCKKLFSHLEKLDKPFILLIPTLKLHTNYISDTFGDKNLQLIIPRRRIHYIKYENGKPVPDWKPLTPFDSIFYCYKMNLPKDIIFLKK